MNLWCCLSLVIVSLLSLPSKVVSRVFRDRLTDEFAWRELEYHSDTGDLFFVGEAWHGLDWEEGFWWCGMNYDDKGNGLMDFLMSKTVQQRQNEQQIDNRPSWMTEKDYPILVMKPLTSSRVWVNQRAPSSNKPPALYSTTRPNTTDYKRLVPDTLDFLAMLETSSGMVYFGLDSRGIELQNNQVLPPGDGTKDRDNGVRVDIAHFSNLKLSQQDLLELAQKFESVPIAKYNVTSKAYPFIPTDHSPDI